MTFTDVLEDYFVKCFELFGHSRENMWKKEYTIDRRKVRKCNELTDLLVTRTMLREYGLDKFKEELIQKKVLNSDMSICAEIIPDDHGNPSNYNVFARYVAGTTQPAYDPLNHPEFFVAKQLPENDVHVFDPQWIGRSSMSTTHLFVVPRKLSDWTLINGLTLGLENPREVYDMLIRMREYGKTLVPKGHTPGFFLHIMPFNSIQLLHLHVLDMDELGPTYEDFEFKNLPLDVMLEVLQRDF